MHVGAADGGGRMQGQGLQVNDNISPCEQLCVSKNAHKINISDDLFSIMVM
jgi:hypothetical protein